MAYQVLSWNSYLRNRLQYCNINGCTSDFIKTSCGVPQGSILGPLLFLIYVNDLPDSVENANITMFADDTSLFRSFKLKLKAYACFIKH